MNKKSLPNEFTSLPTIWATKCTLCPLFHPWPRPPQFFAQTPKVFAQPSTFARPQAAPWISGSLNTMVQMEGDRRFVYNCCHSLDTQNTTNGRQLPRQAVTDWRRYNLLHTIFSSSWHADSTRTARSGGTSVTGSNPSHRHDARQMPAYF